MLLACAAALAITLVFAGAASAATVTVDNVGDNLDGNDTSMAGDDDGACTLREAVEATNTDSDLNGADDCDYVGAAGGADTINFATDAITYNLVTIGGDDGGENGNQRGDLDIEAGPGLTIDGDGSMGTGITINANDSDRALHIESGPVTIEGTTITQGRADFTGSEKGGGILNQGGNLTLINSSVVNNIADVAGAGIETNGSVNTQITNSNIEGNSETATASQAATGAGIDVPAGGGGSLTLTNSQVKNNTAQASSSTAAGGGIYFAPATSATLSVTDSRIVDNTTNTQLGFASDGGGVAVAGASGSTVSFNRALIKDNDAASSGGNLNSDVHGGGVHLNGPGATFTDSWIKGNQGLTSATADNQGAGIYNNSSGTVRLVGTTVSANLLLLPAIKAGAGIYNLGTLVLLNSSVDGNDASDGTGGGLKQVGGTATIVNSTFANNASSSGGVNMDVSGGALAIRGSISDAGGDDCAGTITSGGYNVGSDNTCSFSGTGDIENSSDILLALQDNGGPDAGGTTGGAAEPVETRAPDFPVSDAIDRVTAGSCTDDAAATLTKDQRGSPRPLDGDGDSLENCDSGAVEVAACQGAEATIIGTSGNDVGTIDGTSGADVIVGAGGNDTIDAGTGADKVCGGAGADTIAGDPADAADQYNGGGGSGDELSYAGVGTGVTADLGLATATGSDTIAPGTIENLRGGTNNDNFIGNSADNNLAGGAGDDDLDGAGGTNTADYTGAPAVTASLEAGTASGDGSDTFLDIQNLRGGPQGDNLTGDGSGNVIEGGSGTDTITGLGGMDDLQGEANDDSIFARDGVQDAVDCAGDAADSVEADQMGVDAIDPSCENVSFFVPPVTTPPATTPPATTPAAAAGPTGQQAAALKKCKKKKGAARKKCKKKAKKLPV